MQTVPVAFKRAWRLRCTTRSARMERRALKQQAKRATRRGVRQALKTGDEVLMRPAMFASAYDVI